MKNVILIAPPAAGKGTQASLLKERSGFEHISTGDLLREVVASGTDFGNKLAALIDRGHLVADGDITKILKDKIDSLSPSVNIVFDGYPRNLEQIATLDEILSTFDRQVNDVIYLYLSKEDAMKRVTSRIICSQCGTVYNEYVDTFKIDGECNQCSAKLTKRNDDNEQVFNNRYDTYINKTQPVVDYYKEKGILHVVEANQDKEKIFNQIVSIIGGDQND